MKLSVGACTISGNCREDTATLVFIFNVPGDAKKFYDEFRTMIHEGRIEIDVENPTQVTPS